MIRLRNFTVITLSAEWFDRPSSPSYNKYLPLPNELHFRAEHIQSIVKVMNNV